MFSISHSGTLQAELENRSQNPSCSSPSLPKLARPIPIPANNLSPALDQINMVKFMVQSIDIQS